MRYNVILFDADDTLFDFHTAQAESLRQTCEAYGLAFGEALLEKYHKINVMLWDAFEQGNITQAELRLRRFDLLFEEFSLQADSVKVNDLYVENLGKCTFLLEGAVELCKTLSENCKLYIVTNGLTDTQIPRLKNSLLAPYIFDMFISEEIGAAKPAKAYFDEVFRRIGAADRQRMILLGDSPSSDIIGGKNAGIDTCLFIPPHKKGYVPPDCGQNYQIESLCDFLPIVSGETVPSLH